MPRACTVCTHQDRALIDAALVAGTSAPQIAAIHRVSDDAVTRHRAHLVLPLKQAQAVRVEVEEDVRQALDVVQQLKAINQAALGVLKDARSSGDGELVLKAVDRVQKQIELQAKLLGDLDERPTLNVLVSPEWQELVSALRQILAPHPAILAEVSGRLVALEGGRAHAA
jgi:hypothetical protein